ncbi:hypothetical protein [Commensalibacter communis]|uniref:hypothetical protein n=1 Tax=Commensalibacter communis TaxID=2972786 RepID=UPI00232EDB65|nr:hypothetical protein [Commensalibacter communis]
MFHPLWGWGAEFFAEFFCRNGDDSAGDFAPSFNFSRGSSFLSATADSGKVSAIKVNNSFFMVDPC